MKALLALGVIVGLLGATAALTAPAGAKTSPLARKVAVLQRQVKVLQKQVIFLRGEISANYTADACGWALTADTFQVSWGLIDSHNPPAYFGTQTQVSDKGACADLSPAVPRSLAAPPKTTIFQPLINWINP